MSNSPNNAYPIEFEVEDAEIENWCIRWHDGHVEWGRGALPRDFTPDKGRVWYTTRVESATFWVDADLG